jgi:hypothetical protein
LLKQSPKRTIRLAVVFVVRSGTGKFRGRYRAPDLGNDGLAAIYADGDPATRSEVFPQPSPRLIPCCTCSRSCGISAARKNEARDEHQ